MKKFTTTIFILAICSLSLSAQGPQGVVAPDMQDLVSIPNSPEAAAFVEYGNTDVSLFTGRPNISIPIHTMQGRELQVPISLNYSASGIRVEQVATWVGLGWNLNVGGSITRNVKGLPDDYVHETGIAYYPHYSHINHPLEFGRSVSEQLDYFKDNVMGPNVNHTVASDWATNYIRFMQEVTEGRIDTKMDTYSFNANGLSGTLVIDYTTGTASCLEIPDLIAVPTFDTNGVYYNSHGVLPIIGWTLTDNQGNVYVFNQKEKTYANDGTLNDLERRDYYSAWNLTQITSKSGKDVLYVIYGPEYTWTNIQPVAGGDMRIDNPNDNTPCDQPGNTNFAVQAEYQITKADLQSVSMNNEIVSFQRDTIERNDLKGTYALNKIEYRNINLTIKTVELQTSYFGDPNSLSEYDSRLKLDAVKIYSISGSENLDPQIYTLSYNSNDPPSRDSKGQDYWGFYNGGSATTMIPYNSAYDDGNPGFTGADRSVDPNYVQNGILTSIQYPTGGTTEFYYESPYEVDEIGQIVYTTIRNEGLAGAVNPADPMGYFNCDDGTAEFPEGTENFFKVLVGEEGGFKFSFTSGSGTGSEDRVQLAALYSGPKKPLCDILDNPQSEFIFRQQGDILTSTELILNLDPGTYQMIMMSNWTGSSYTMQVESIDTTQNIVPNYVGGLRTYKIVDKTDPTTVAKSRFFYYDDMSLLDPSQINADYLGSNPASTGVLHQPAIFDKLMTSEIFDSELDLIFSCETIHRFASNRSAATNNLLSHSTVSEVILDENDNYNGFTVYEYYNENEAQSSDPYVQTDLLNGNLLEKRVYKSDAGAYTLLVKEENSFEQVSLPGSLTGFFFETEGNFFEDIQLWEDAQDPSLEYFQYIGVGTAGTPPNVQPTPCIYTSPPAEYKECLLDNGTAALAKQMEVPYLTGGNKWLKQLGTTVTQYAEFTESVTRTNNFWDNPSHYQITKTIMTNSDGKTHESHMAYAHDVSNTELINANRVAEVVNKKNVVDGVDVFEQETVYTTHSGKYLPDKILYAFNGNTPEERMQILQYDSNGNIEEYRAQDGVITTILWGYGGTVPVLKVSGASYADVSANIGGLAFDEDSNNAYSLTKHLNLVNALPNAQVTSWLHDPGIGMTEMRDPNGRQTRYEYDIYNRLEKVIDHEGNVVQQNEYHYANN